MTKEKIEEVRSCEECKEQDNCDTYLAICTEESESEAEDFKFDKLERAGIFDFLGQNCNDWKKMPPRKEVKK